MNITWVLFFTTVGTAAVISALVMFFFSMEWRHNLHATNKTAHRFLVAVVFGLFAIYGSIASVEIGGAVTNCRDLAVLYAGVVGGPVAGIGAAIIGCAFRYFVQGIAMGGNMTIALSCTIATLLTGFIGSTVHLYVRKRLRYNPIFGFFLAAIVECIHLGPAILFGFGEVVKIVAFPMIAANSLGMVFCIFMYKKCASKWSPEEKADEDEY